MSDILNSLMHDDSAFAAETLKLLRNGAPLSIACTVEMLHRLRGPAVTLERALDLEYRFTARSMEHGDFLEGIRAAIIDKDRSPLWQYADMNVPGPAVSQMLMPLGNRALKFGEMT